MQDKKPAQHTQKFEQDQGFALFRSDTIQLWSCLEGYQQLDEPSLKSLSEDISYRIRESLDSAVSFMHHCKRTELRTRDVNKAFQMLNIEKTFGYETRDGLKYRAIKTDDLNDKVLNQFKSKLYELKDSEIVLKLPDENIDKDMNFNKNSLHGNWFVLHGNSIDYRENILNLNIDLDLLMNDNEDFDIENEIFFTQLSQEFTEYYNKVTSIILGDHDCPDEDENMFQMVLEDLRTNSKIQPVVSYFIVFFHQTIHSFIIIKTSRINEITSLDYLERVLDALKYLILNKNVFLAPKGLFSKILSSLLFCTVQNSHFYKNTNSLITREKAAFVLVMFLRLYQRYSIETIKYTLNTFLKPNLNENLNSDKQVINSLGIVFCLTQFGGQIINEFYDQLINLAVQSDLSDTNISYLSIILNRNILKCLLVHFKWTIRKSISEQSNEEYSFERIFCLYKTLTDLFSDGFVNQAYSLPSILRYRNVFEIKIKVLNDDNQITKIRLRSLPNRMEIRNQSLTDVFENYSKIRPKRIRINYGSILKSKCSTGQSAESLIRNKKIIVIGRFNGISGKKQINQTLTNLNYLYKDSFL